MALSSSCMQPYRESVVREGVALPRDERAMRVWSAACAAAALTFVAFVMWWRGRDPEQALVPIVTLGAAWILGIVAVAIRMVHGRTHRIGLLFVLAMTPAFAGETLAVFDGYPRLMSSMLSADIFALIASRRLPLYAISAVASLVTCAGAVGAVVTIRRPRGRADGKTNRSLGSGTPAVLGVLGAGVAIAFTILRAHGAHRDGLGGALTVALAFLIAPLGAIVARRVRVLDAWHDHAEASSVTRVAMGAFVAMALAGFSVERAVLANDELVSLRALAKTGPFDERLELARALHSAWTSHPVYAGFVALAALLALTSVVLAARELTRVPRTAGSRADAMRALLGIAAMIGITTRAEAQVHGAMARSTASPSSSMATMSAMSAGTELPIAPGTRSLDEPDEQPVTLSREEEPPVRSEPAPRPPQMLVVDRRTPTSAILTAVSRSKLLRSLFVEAASDRVMAEVGSARALVGAPRTALAFEWFDDPFFLRTKVHSPESHPFLEWTSSGTLLVLDDGEVARLVYRKHGDQGFAYGKTHGVSLRRDLESRASRGRVAADLAREIGAHELRATKVIVLAPHPRGDAQALVDAIVAVGDLIPSAFVVLTGDIEPMSTAMTGGVLVSP